MEQAFVAFRQFLTAEKRASEHTVRAYLHDLDELRAYAESVLGRPPALDELDVIVCRSYLASLHGKNDAVTIGRKLSSLRAFFRLAVRRRLCKSSPVAALRAPKRAKRLPSFLGKDDVGRLLDGGTRDEELGHDACARTLEAALFEVIYGAGLRVSEACNLDLGDVELDSAGALVRVRHGKGRKDRIVPLGSKARQAYAVVWVNPLKGHPDYQPLAAGMRAALPSIDRFLPGHNLASLEALAEMLSGIERRHAA